MSFPNTQGEPWYLWANGFPLQLLVTTDRDDGEVGGNIIDGDGNSVSIASGTWNDASKTLKFSRTLQDTGEVQTYTGFLFDQPTNFNGTSLSNPENYWVLAGSFTSVGGFEDPNRRGGMGWFAVAKAV